MVTLRRLVQPLLWGTASAALVVAVLPANAAQVHLVHRGVVAGSEIPPRAGESVLSVAMPEPYAPRRSGPAWDDYRCFVMDPKLSSDQWLTGTRFTPGNAKVVHHIILFRLDADRVAEAKVKDAADPGPGWTCFGGPGFRTSTGGSGGVLDAAPWLAAWAPGGTDQVIPDGLGIPMPAGTQMVMQVHYNLRTAVGSDTTSLGLRLRPRSESMTSLGTRLLAAPVELPCLPGETGRLCSRSASIDDVVRRFGSQSRSLVEGLKWICGATGGTTQSGQTQSCNWPVTEPMTIHAAAPHMHLLGSSMTIEANPGTERAATILSQPSYDFDQQGAVWLSEPIRLQAGDILRITCTWNPALRKALPAFKGTKPRYVVWGEGTTDEMCLGVLTFAKG